MTSGLFPHMSPRATLAATIIASSLPFLLVMIFPDQLHFVMDSASYLLFHNIAEFFSIMVSLSIFSVGWYTYNQSKDRHALFLSAAFLSIGLMDFMHTMASAAMPAFITPNSTNKSAQFWVAARLFSALAFLLSAYIYKERDNKWLPKAAFSKATLLIMVLGVPALVLTGITFYPSYMPDTFITGVGLTSFKIYSEYLIVCLLFLATTAYWKRMKRSGDGLLMYYVAAFIISVFSELVFTAYKIDFDIHNVLGHIYKVAAFCLIYVGIFVSSVRNPYLERKQAEEALRTSKEELELRVEERTIELRDGNIQLRIELTEREKAEVALRKSEERYRTLFNSMTEGFALHEIICDEKGEPFDYRFLDINPAFEKLTGLKREIVVGRTYNDILPDDDPRWVRAYGAVALTGEPTHFENYSPALNKHFEVFAYRPEPGQFAVLFRDITERKKAEEALRDSERLYRAIGESIDYGVWVCAPDGRNIYVSKSFLNMVGLTQEQCSNFGWGDVLHPDDAERTIRQWKECVETEGIWDIEHCFRGIDGQWHSVLARGVPVKNERGETIYWAGINLDISRIKQAEEALREARDELEDRVQERTFELTEAYETLQKEMDEHKKTEEQLIRVQKLEALGTLAGGIAHDFNNILAGLIGFTEMVLEDIAPESPEHKRLELVLKGANRGRDLVRQILTFSRKSEQDKKPLALYQIIEDGLKLLRPMLPSTIEIMSKSFTDDDWIFADSGQMHQILMNLCTNAAHAMREKGGRLDIRVFKTSLREGNTMPLSDMKAGEYVVLKVSDTGSGMTPETLKQVFDPFFTTKQPGEGTGLGLSVVHGIVESHDGYITVESEPEKGTTFHIYLPRITDDTHPQGYESISIPGGNERILIVDDEDMLVELNRQRLSRLGYEVVATTSSVEALTIFGKEPNGFALVITDYTMPNLTGMDLAVELLKVRATVPIILCTGQSDTVSPEKAKEIGIRGLLTKPLTNRELAKAVRRMLDIKA
jgi:PAS domain S-box-containing protein